MQKLYRPAQLEDSLGGEATTKVACKLPVSTASVRLGWLLAALLLVAYVVVLAELAPLALQDYQNHLARALVMSDLIFHRGAGFGDVFEYHFLHTPYILGDLALCSAIEVLGVDRASTLWSIITLLSLPCALLFYLRAAAIPSEGTALLLILSLYLSTDWFFLMGFLEFRLGIAITLVTLAIAQLYRRNRTPAVLLAYLCVLALGYATHLTALIFSTALVGGSAVFRLLRRASDSRTELLLLVPCAALLAWYFVVAVGYRQPGDLVENPYLWGPIEMKVRNLTGEFYRYGARTDAGIFAVMVLCLFIYVGRVPLRALQDAAAAELLALSGVMFGLYALLPRGYSEAYFVDVRALPLATLFALLAFMSLRSSVAPGRSRRPILAVCIAALVAAGNLAYLTKHLGAHRLWLRQYRAVIAHIPLHARVLPIYTEPADGRVVPFLHAFSFAVIDRGAVVPYLQTGDTGNAQKYLRYRERPYAPTQTWYLDNESSQVNWTGIACEYDWILATEPVDSGRLPLPLSLKFRNGSAALFALPPRDCRVDYPDQ